MSVPRPPRLAAFLAIALAGCGSARAEVPGAAASAAAKPDASAPPPRELIRPEDVPEVDPPAGPAAMPVRVVMDPLDVIRESIFGEAKEEDWRPLTLRSFFTEGWDTPYANAPEGTNGAPKQNWIGTPAGVFGRFFTVDTFYTNHLNNVPGLFLSPNAPFMPVHPFTNGNQYTGFSTILLPLNSRMELLIGTNFIASNKSSPAGGYVGNWGDTGVQARFHLIDQRNFSLVGLVGERIPTGKSVNGSGINYVTPGLEFWSNFAEKWVLRGGTSINILTGRKSSTSVAVNQLSVGRYFSGKDARVFKEFEAHLTVNNLSDVSGGAGHINDLYLFPGFRFGLGEGHKTYVLGGVQVPVSGPQAYVWQPQLSLTRNY